MFWTSDAMRLIIWFISRDRKLAKLSYLVIDQDYKKDRAKGKKKVLLIDLKWN